MNGERWCEWQTKCVEDTGPDDWTCTAHLAEGHAFRCGKRNMADAKKVPGRCEDASSMLACPDGCLKPEQEKRVRK